VNLTELLPHFGEALLSQCGLTSAALLLVIAGLLWWVRGQRQAYSELETARDRDRETAAEDARQRSRTFEALSSTLSEMKGNQAAQGTLLAALVARK
jgi:hypothetical protein